MGTVLPNRHKPGATIQVADLVNFNCDPSVDTSLVTQVWPILPILCIHEKLDWLQSLKQFFINVYL